MENPESLSLYLHIPYCFDKCSYCDFFSLPHYGTPDTEALEAERSRVALRGGRLLEKLAPGSIPTIYIGGGTPSSIGPGELEKYLELVRSLVEKTGLPFDGEYTIEANPRDISPSFLSLLSGYGVNRISLGAQSLSDDDFAYLGRSGGAEYVLRAFDLLKGSWKGRLSADIIAGIPGQRMAAVGQLIHAAKGAGADHLSIYQLTVEDGTPLHAAVAAGRCRAPGELEYTGLFKGAARAAEAAGYRRYEVSAFAVPGGESRHNLRYWHMLPYLGLGRGAVSTLPDGRGGAVRLTVERDGTETRETVNPREFFIERLMTGFRLVSGPDPAVSLNGRGIRELCPETVRAWLDSGRLEEREGRLRLTDEGLDLLDTFLVRLLSELEPARPERS